MTSTIERFVIHHLNSPRPRVAVAGDIMVDERHQVAVDRLSPEFPFPVWSTAHYSARTPGGAGNVAWLLTPWVNPFLVGRCDTEVRYLIKAHGIDVGHVSEGIVSTPVKSRYYCESTPLARIDLSRETVNGLGNWGFPSNLDALILSDYDKGAFAKFKPEPTSAPLVVVNGKRGPLDRWRNCTALVVNRAEAREIAGDYNVGVQLDKMIKDSQCSYAIITNGGISPDYARRTQDARIAYYLSDPRHVSGSARSVVGAGDCFVAFLTLALHHQFNIHESVEIAHAAGACYVRNFPNRPIMPHELLASVSPARAKLLPAAAIPARPRDHRLGLINGCFDLIHVGHLNFIRRAREACDRLVVAVNSDDSVASNKGQNRPVIPLADRMEMLAALPEVDHVVAFDAALPVAAVKDIDPDIYITSSEYVTAGVGARFAHAKMRDIPVHYVDRPAGSDSTSEIVRRAGRAFNYP